jgi:hypothetical protein
MAGLLVSQLAHPVTDRIGCYAAIVAQHPTGRLADEELRVCSPRLDIAK